MKGWLVVGSSLFGLRCLGPCTVYDKLKTVVTTVCKQLEFRHNVNLKTFLLCVFFVVVVKHGELIILPTISESNQQKKDRSYI